MFILSEKNIGIPLSEINKISITYFAAKSEILNIYDINFDFDENIVPLITSILETQPKIHNYKTYNCSDTITTIKEYSKSILQPYNTYPSFYYDIDTIENCQNTNKLSKKLCILEAKIINTVIDNNDNQLIRMYNELPAYNPIPQPTQYQSPTQSPTQTPTSTITISNDFIQTILSEKEYKKISWEFDWGNFEIIIDLTSKDKHQGTYQGKQQITYKAQYKITIDIIEDNKIIASRLIKINDILQKINKIKSAFIINEQECLQQDHR